MATKTPTKPVKAEKSSLDYLHAAIEDLDRARERASAELRERLDGITDRVRDIAQDTRGRVGDEADAWERRLDHASDDVRREIAVRAVRAQQSPEALKDLSAEIRRRKAELDS